MLRISGRERQTLDYTKETTHITTSYVPGELSTYHGCCFSHLITSIYSCFYPVISTVPGRQCNIDSSSMLVTVS